MTNVKTMISTFSFTGTVQTWTVPINVTVVKIQAWGAEGGAGFSTLVQQNILGLGGQGGFASGLLRVQPGQVLSIYVGGRGMDGSIITVVPGGYNGGGSARSNDSESSGSGGGASDVRTGPLLTQRLIVAGGGGGASGDSAVVPYPVGGVGGGLVGGAVGGGTQTAGGAGTEPGSFGLGGSSQSPFRGAGGGGWYGGGTGGSGGGGSGYVDPSLLQAQTTQGGRLGDGLVMITAFATKQKDVFALTLNRCRTKARVNFKVRSNTRYSHPSGSYFPVGVTIVESVTRIAGQEFRDSFKITVRQRPLCVLIRTRAGNDVARG